MLNDLDVQICPSFQEQAAMRLYDDEKTLLLRLLKQVKGEVYLFGSRVDEQKK